MEQISVEEPADPPIVLRIASFGPLTLHWHDHHTGKTVPFPEEKLHGKGAAPALSLLKVLISQPNRYAARDWILEQFWPDTESSKAEGRMDDVSSYLRTLLSSPSGKKEPFLHYLRTSKQSGSGYRLAPHPLIWVDADAFEWYVERAARLDRFGHDSLSLWEQAYQLASRGAFLPEERYSDWTLPRRERLEGQYRQCVHRLVHLLQEMGAYEEALLRLRGYWQGHQTDEDALRVLIEMLSERERYQEAERYYEQAREALEVDGREPDAKTRDVMELVRTVRVQRKSTKTINVRIIEKSIPLQYEKNIRSALDFHRTHNAQNIFQEVNSDIHDLERLEDQVHRDLLPQVRMLLIGNYLLATKIVKDQKQYVLAYAYANNAVRIAKYSEDKALLSTTRYNRACTKLEWGLLGNIQQGRFKIDTKKVWDAIDDFQKILALSAHEPHALHPQLQGSTQLQLSRAQFALQQDLSDMKRNHILLQADKAADMIGRDPIDEPYTRMLMTGTLSGLHLGGYLLVKASILNTADLSDKAIIELYRLKYLTEQTYRREETRYEAWSDIAMSEALLRLEEYPEATMKAKTALITCHHINSVQNVTMIADIYSRVTISSYGTSEEVKELGDMLYEWYKMGI